MAGFRYLHAIRARLLADAQLTAMIGDRVFPMHLADVTEAQYPCVTFFQKDGRQAPGTFAPRLVDPAHVLIQAYTQRDISELYDIYDRIQVMLHEQKQSVSNSEVTIHDIREIWANSGIYDKPTNTWQLSTLYIVRASLRNP